METAVSVPRRSADNVRGLGEYVDLKHFALRLAPLAMLGLAVFCMHTRAHAQALPPEVSSALARAGVPRDAISVLVTALPPQPSIASKSTATASTNLPANTVVSTSVQGVGPTVANLQTPARLAHRVQQQVNPASVMKLFTTYAGLDMLGEQFTWKNRVYIDGNLNAGVLEGNLVLRGSGDPKLVLERIEDLFAQVQAKGVREVRGNIVLDRGIFTVPDKNPAEFDDEPLRPYNAAPDGLLVNFKSLIFKFTPDPATGLVSVASEPPIAGVSIPTQVAANGNGCGDWRSGLRADFSSPTQIRFTGGYPTSCGERTWPVAYVQPRAYAARVIEAMWRASGGQLTGSVVEAKTPPGARLLLSAPSLPLASIAADINKFSNNVMAQQLFLTLSSHVRGRGSFEDSQKVLRDWWRERFGPSGLVAPVVENGSGLSRRERASAQSLTALLQHAATSPQAQAFADSLGIAGVDGTVANMRSRNGNSVALGNAQLKTGTLRDVAAIAGYATGQSGTRYSLVAVINHPNAPAARPALDALVEWVVKDQ
jgi:serine-type D-Ala-D-Ala carboxypeptidase/endopeptidase (penicillin-binding protein 4)